MFAVIGTFSTSRATPSSASRSEHDTADLALPTQALVDKAPPGMMLTPDITPERRLDVIMSLLRAKKRSTGKKVGTLARRTRARAASRRSSSPRSTTSVVERGTDGDAHDHRHGHHRGAGAARQLHRAVEGRRHERADPLGETTSAKQFVEKIKTADSRHARSSPTPRACSVGAQEESKAHVNPNPYDGIDHRRGPDRRGAHEDAALHVLPRDLGAGDGPQVPSTPTKCARCRTARRNDIYGSVEDACL